MAKTIQPLNTNNIFKVGLCFSIVFAALIYAWPSVLPLFNSVEVSWSDSSFENQDLLYATVKEITLEDNLEPLKIIKNSRSITIVFDSVSQQLKAQESISQALGDRAIASLNLVRLLPSWLQAIGASAINLGLDLRGGVYFLFEIDIDSLQKERINSYKDEIVRELRENNIQFDRRRIDIKNNRLVIPAQSRVDDTLIDQLINNSDFSIIQNPVTLEIELFFAPEIIDAIVEAAQAKNLVSLRRRLNELGVAEPQITGVGKNRIAVQMPGVKDSNQASRILDKASTLEFRLEASRETLPSQIESINFKDSRSGEVSAWLERRTVIKGENVIDAQVGYDINNQPVVQIVLDDVGGAIMFRVTKDNINRRMGVVLVDSKLQQVEASEEVEVVQDRQLLTLPVIRGNFGNRFQIEGTMNAQEASDLALLLRAGALAAPMKRIEERTVGPSLGEENIRAGMFSAIGGFIAVLVFMIAYYRLWGLFASFALTTNLALILALMSQLGAALSLPGIAGLVLTVGMSVDANVLIFSRIKEEFKQGSSLPSAIYKGYERALVSILDANITTLIVAVILYMIGTGPVRGFAVTLSFGIMTSMFTAIIVTRILVNYTVKWEQFHPPLSPPTKR